MKKQVKKMLIVFTVVSLLAALTACDWFYRVYIPVDKEVACIELIYYNNPDARNNPLVEYPLDLDRLEVLEDLISEKMENFLQELSKIGYVGGKPELLLASHDGIGVRITYEDGSFQITTLTEVNGEYCFFVGVYNDNGNVVRTTNLLAFEFEQKFRDVVNEYFTTQI